MIFFIFFSVKTFFSATRGRSRGSSSRENETEEKKVNVFFFAFVKNSFFVLQIQFHVSCCLRTMPSREHEERARALAREIESERKNHRFPFRNQAARLSHSPPRSLRSFSSLSRSLASSFSLALSSSSSLFLTEPATRYQ